MQCDLFQGHIPTGGLVRRYNLADAIVHASRGRIDVWIDVQNCEIFVHLPEIEWIEGVIFVWWTFGDIDVFRMAVMKSLDDSP